MEASREFYLKDSSKDSISTHESAGIGNITLKCYLLHPWLTAKQFSFCATATARWQRQLISQLISNRKYIAIWTYSEPGQWLGEPNLFQVGRLKPSAFPFKSSYDWNYIRRYCESKRNRPHEDNSLGILYLRFKQALKSWTNWPQGFCLFRILTHRSRKLHCYKNALA